MKEVTRKDMRSSGSPLVLWDYCMEHWALIFQITAKKLFQFNGTRQTSPISASMSGTSGYIIEMPRHSFPTRRNG
jgi:hypothetical protein